MSVLFRLLLISVRGRLVRAARQLRQPKYLAGLVIGVGWAMLWMGSWLTQDEVRGILFSGAQARMLEQFGEFLQLAVSLVLAFAFSFGWFFPLGRLALPLKEAELHLLLPAPLSRRRIIQYALLKAQIPTLISSLIFAVMLSGGRPASFVRAFIGLWLLITVWELHGKMRALFFLRRKEVSRRTARLWWLAVAGPLLVGWGLLVPRVHAVALRVVTAVREVAARDEIRFGELLAGFGDIEMDAVSRAILAPFRWLVAPVFSDGWLQFLLAVAPVALAVVVLHETVVRSRARFEETALQHARRDADKKDPSRQFKKLSSGRRRNRPFRLAPHGRPETAILWKNLMQVGRAPLSRVLLVTLGAAALLTVIPPYLGAPSLFYNLEVAIGGGFLAIGPLFIPMGRRHDLRTELLHLELVRTWPLTGPRLVLAEVLGPASTGTYAAFCGGLAVASGYYGGQLFNMMKQATVISDVIVPAGRTVFGAPFWAALPFLIAGALVVGAGLAMLVSALQNLAALLFPAWIGLGPTSAKGMSAMGHQMLLATGLGIVLLVALIPGTLLVTLAIVLHAAFDLPWSPAMFPIWACLGAFPLFVEALLVVRAGGRLWDNLDASREILESGR